MGQVMPMSWRFAEIGNCLTSKLIYFPCTIQAQQTETRLLSNLCRLKLHGMFLKDSKAAIEEQERLAIVSLCCVDLGNIQFFSRYRNFLSLVTGKGCAGLFVQGYRLAEPAHGSKCNSFVTSRAGDIELDSFAMLNVCFDGTIEEPQCLLILAQFVVGNRSIDINLPRAQVFTIAPENFTCGCGIAYSFTCAVQLQTGADTPNTCACPANFITNIQKFCPGCVQKQQGRPGT